MQPKAWLCAVACLVAGVCRAQHADDNAVVAAEDGFGLTLGTESLGIYNDTQIRGFNPQTAGNARIAGMYFNQQQGSLSPRVLEGSTIKVGSSALGYSFPAPTGIVDFDLRHVGEQPTATMVAYAGPFQTHALDIDGQLPIVAEKLYLPVGVSYRIDAPLEDLTTRAVGFGLAPLWKVNSALSLRFIFDWQEVTENKSMPEIFMRDSSLPPPIRPRYWGSSWARSDFQYRTLGSLLTWDTGRNWTVAAGVFRSLYASPKSFNELYVDTTPDGVGQHAMVAYPEQYQTTLSGEIRLSGHFSEGERRHEIVLSASGYDASTRYGGADVESLGSGSIQQPLQVEQPAFNYSATTNDRTHLWSSGIAYRGLWSRYGQLSVGLSQARYAKSVLESGQPAISNRKTPLRGYANTSIQLASRFSLYAGYTQGLEDTGVAPSDAANRGAILPSSLTWQRDAGFRYLPVDGMVVTGGVFDVHKPYFNIGPDNRYVQLGQQRHRGLELSVAGELTRGLNVVAGGEWLHPEVSVDSADRFTIGRSAVGADHRLIQVSLNYQMAGWAALSWDAVVTNVSWVAASLDNVARAPGYTNLDLGAHYKLTVLGCPGSLRLQVLNVSNHFFWGVSDSSGFSPGAPRRVQAYLTVDLPGGGSK